MIVLLRRKPGECPYCGSRATVVYLPGAPRPWQVRCTNAMCLVSGACYPTRRKALIAWNYRVKYEPELLVIGVPNIV